MDMTLAEERMKQNTQESLDKLQKSTMQLTAEDFIEKVIAPRFKNPECKVAGKEHYRSVVIYENDNDTGYDYEVIKDAARISEYIGIKGDVRAKSCVFTKSSKPI